MKNDVERTVDTLKGKLILLLLYSSKFLRFLGRHKCMVDHFGGARAPVPHLVPLPMRERERERPHLSSTQLFLMHTWWSAEPITSGNQSKQVAKLK